MKGLTKMLGMLLLGVSLTSCFGATDAESAAEGKWILAIDKACNVFVDINGDGTGMIIMTENDHGKTKQMLHENVKVASEGEDLYLTFANGNKAHMYVKGYRLYADNGEAFTRLN